MLSGSIHTPRQLDEALAARPRKFLRQKQEEQTATLNLEDVLETIRNARYEIASRVKNLFACRWH